MNRLFYLAYAVFLFFALSSCEKKQEEAYPYVHFEYEPNKEYKSIYIHNTVKFDASPSFDKNTNLNELQFRWDFDNDGVWETEFSNNPIAVHTFYEAEYNNFVYLEVMNSKGDVTGLIERFSIRSAYYLHEDFEEHELCYNNDCDAYSFYFYYKDLYTYKDTLWSFLWLRNNLDFSIHNKYLKYDFKKFYNWEAIGSIEDSLTIFNNDMLRLHVPSVQEWKNFMNEISTEELAASALLAPNLWFQAETQGKFDENIGFVDVDSCAYYWTSDSYSETEAYALKINKNNLSVGFTIEKKSCLIPVRVFYKIFQTSSSN